MTVDVDLVMNFPQQLLTGHGIVPSLTVRNPGENAVDYDPVTLIDNGYGVQEIIDWPDGWLNPGESETFDYAHRYRADPPSAGDGVGLFSYWGPNRNDLDQSYLLPTSTTESADVVNVVEYGDQSFDHTDKVSQPVTMLPGGQITSAIPEFTDGEVVVDVTVVPTHSLRTGPDIGTTVGLVNTSTGDYDISNTFFADGDTSDDIEVSVDASDESLLSLRLGLVSNHDKHRSGVDDAPELYNPVSFVVQAGDPRNAGDVLVEGIDAPSEVEI